METGGTRYYYTCNTLYSVAALADINGNVVERYKYDPYGRVVVLNAAGAPKADPKYSEFGNPYTFTGRNLEAETGLMYYRNRYYDVDLGRFIGRDPIGYEGSERNLYEYARSLPSGRKDPTGEKCTKMHLLASAEETGGKIKKIGDLLKLAKDSSTKLKKDECISILELQGHSTPTEFQIGNQATGLDQDDDSCHPGANMLTRNNADWLGKQLRGICFCCPCYIILGGCNSGIEKGDEFGIFEPWPQTLADSSGCTVKATGGWKKGTLFHDNIVISGDSSEGNTSYYDNEDTYATGAKKWYTFTPRKPRECKCCCASDDVGASSSQP